jgi:DNA-binding transcriptional LysR family regulator
MDTMLIMSTINAGYGAERHDLDSAALAALLAVIETGSFTEAARVLHLSQPAVSLAIKRLEDRLGTALLVRTRKRVAPSRPGEVLAAGARQAFEAIGNAVAQIENEHAEPSGRVVLGVHESLAAYSLPTFMARFLRMYPKVELKLWNGRSMEVEAELTAGRVDLALIVNASRHPDLIVAPMFDDSVELVHCAAARRRADPASVLGELPLIYVPELTQSQQILAQLQKRRIAVPRLLPCSSLELVKSLVLDEVGVGILPRRVAQHGTRRKLYTLSPPLPLYRDRIALVRRFDVPTTAAIRVVIDELSAHCRAMQ